MKDFQNLQSIKVVTENPSLTIEIGTLPSDENKYNHIILSEGNKRNIIEKVKKAKSDLQIAFTSEMYNSIVLTEKKFEFFRQKKESYFEEIQRETEVKHLTKSEYLNFLIDTFPKRFPNQELKFEGLENNFFEMMLCYFTKDDNFLKMANQFSKTQGMQRFSFEKGIALIGEKGVGKTSIMKLFALNPINPYKVKSVLYDLVADAEEYKLAGLEKYSSLEKVSSYDSKHYYFNNTHIGICLDDAGVKEEKLKSWGNDRNVIDIVIQQRDFNNVPSNMTHLTTNDEPEEWKRKYDGRTIDRYRRMFNVFWYPTTESKRV